MWRILLFWDLLWELLRQLITFTVFAKISTHTLILTGVNEPQSLKNVVYRNAATKFHETHGHTLLLEFITCKSPNFQLFKPNSAVNNELGVPIVLFPGFGHKLIIGLLRLNEP